MSAKKMISFTCDGCGVAMLVDDADLVIPPIEGISLLEKNAFAPKGWLIMTACALDQWAGKLTHPNSQNTSHVCGVPCAARFLNKFAIQFQDASVNEHSEPAL
jgi:hypothetical protein